MESVSDTIWDLVICGTGLQQSLLALALSRSDKKILHIDPNNYYGGPEAAFTLQDVDNWIEAISSPSSPLSLFRHAAIIRPDPPTPSSQIAPPAALLAPGRSYLLALAPHIIYTQSQLLAQLVSSQAYRQLEFLAVGSFFVLVPPSSSSPSSSSSSSLSPPRPILARIPSTREDVFSATNISAKAKRGLIKFLRSFSSMAKAVVGSGDQGLSKNPQQDKEVDASADADADELWRPYARRPLVEFLTAEFRITDPTLQAYIVALTLSLEGNRVSTDRGLAAIATHLGSMGAFGVGFAAVYPKWGGASEVAQVGCRAAAVGGATYMLGAGIVSSERTKLQVPTAGRGESEGHEVGKQTEETELLSLKLTSGDTVRTRLLVRGGSHARESQQDSISRLVAILSSPLPSLFQPTLEGAPTPAIAAVAFPPGSLMSASDEIVYALVHSSDTGECPVGQTVLYLTTPTRSESKQLVEAALRTFLTAIAAEGELAPHVLYKLYYEQAQGPRSAFTDQSASGLDSLTFSFPAPAASLSFDDSVLETVKAAWGRVMGDATDGAEYMVFSDRQSEQDVDDE